jgi:hypothetical protein
MTQQDDIRRIIREELAPLLARLDALAPALVDVTPADAPPRWRVALDEWLTEQPLGTTGRAADLLPGFLAHSPPMPPRGADWTPSAFGHALARVRDRYIAGRVLRRRADRKGIYIWTIERSVPEAE